LAAALATAAWAPVVGRLVGGRVKLIQRLARLDHGALGEQALLDDAADLRAHLRDAKRHGPSRKERSDGHALRLHDHDAHFGRRIGSLVLARCATAAEQQGSECQCDVVRCAQFLHL
jgi:hypothetical protein